MKFYRRDAKAHVVANKAKTELLLDLFKNKLVTNEVEALRLESPLFTAFHNFAPSEIARAVEEANAKGSDQIVLDASVYLDEADELAKEPPPVVAEKPAPAKPPEPPVGPVAAVFGPKALEPTVQATPAKSATLPDTKTN